MILPVSGRLALPLLLAAFASGCVNLGSGTQSEPVRTYRLDYPPPAAAVTRLPIVLQLSPLGVAALYDREPIVYQEGAHTIGSYFYHRWSTNPARMITDLLARDLVATQHYRAVQQGVSTIPADYRIGGDVEEIEERPDAAACAAHLRIRISLTPAVFPAADAVLFQQAYAENEPSPCNDAPSLVAAMSRAAERISIRLQRDLDAILRSPPPRSPAAPRPR